MDQKKHKRPRFASRRVAVLSSAATLLLGTALTFTGLQSANADPPNYVALGDSYSSGVGAGSYIESSGDCKRSSKAYASLWAEANSPSSFSFTACSGATTTDVLARQLGPLNSNTGLVSITIGGNDTGFSRVMMACLTKSEDDCLEAIKKSDQSVDTLLPPKLDRVYTEIRKHAPSAKVVVLGYPNLYELGHPECTDLTETERIAMNRSGDHLNAAINREATKAGFTFTDANEAFAGHEICSGDSWIHGVTTPADESYHPTAEGQSDGYLPLFTAAAK